MISNFLFHRVNPLRDPLWDPMDNALFDRCLRCLNNKFEVVRIEDIQNRTDIKAKDKIATIMFDDGYKDNLTEAAPLLNKYKLKASFYVVTDCIDFNVPTWTHSLEYRFVNTQKAQIDLPFDKVPANLHHAQFQATIDRLTYVRKLKPALKTIDHKSRLEVLAAVNEQLSDVELPELMMNWNDCKSLLADGHYIGSHTISHCMLGTMHDEKEISDELVRSKQRIADELGYHPLSISYPVGSYNEKVKSLSKKAGYTIGLAVNQKVFDPAKHDWFEVPRIELYNEPWWKTNMRITNRLERFKQLIGYR